MALISSKTLQTTMSLTDEFPLNVGGADFKGNLQSIINYLDTAANYGVSIGLNNTFRTTTVPATYVPFTGGTLVGNLSGITPTAAAHLTRKDYIDSLLAAYLPLAGGTMTGTLVLAGSPSASNDATTKNYVDTAVAGTLKNPIAIDCSANPNYPAANAGATYRVSVAGKIGGASGLDVQVGQFILCHTTSVGGTEAAVGTDWMILDKRRITATTTEQGVIEKATSIEAGLSQLSGATDLYVDGTDLFSLFGSMFAAVGTTSNASYVMGGGDQIRQIILNGRSAVGTGTVTLPVVSSLTQNAWTRITIKDSGGAAGTNNITIQGQSGATIDGQASFILDTNYESADFVTDGTNWFTI